MPRHEQLLGQLRVYAPADDADARDVEALVNLLTKRDDVFSRAHFSTRVIREIERMVRERSAL